jgi:hypothetical protein
MNLFSDSMQSTEELLRKSKKVKRGATLEEAEIDGAWLTAYAKISRRCRDDKDLDVSRYPYELAPGVSPFSGGYFEHREWATRRGMERHPRLRPLFEYEAHYTNSSGYWMSFSSAAMALRGESLKLEGTTGVEEAEMFDVWAMMAVRYGLQVVGLRVEFYLRAGCQEGIYEEVTTGEAERIRSTGAMISSSFVVWQEGPEGRKGRFVVNLSKQSKHWPKGSVRMETLPEYALDLDPERRWCHSTSKRDTDTFGSLRR